MIDAVDLSIVFTDKWCEEVNNRSKWSERKEHLDKLSEHLEKSIKVTSSCGVTVTNHLLRKLFIKESNVKVV